MNYEEHFTAYLLLLEYVVGTRIDMYTVHAVENESTFIQYLAKIKHHMKRENKANRKQSIII